MLLPALIGRIAAERTQSRPFSGHATTEEWNRTGSRQLPLEAGQMMPYARGGAGDGISVDAVYNRLLEDRIIFLGKEFDDGIANRVTAQMLMLATDPTRDIYLYIHSPGGSVTAGMAVYDTMQCIKNDVVTIAMGFCASMGQFLLAACAKGRRFALPHTKTLMHQPSAGFGKLGLGHRDLCGPVGPHQAGNG